MPKHATVDAILKTSNDFKLSMIDTPREVKTSEKIIGHGNGIVVAITEDLESKRVSTFLGSENYDGRIAVNREDYSQLLCWRALLMEVAEKVSAESLAATSRIAQRGEASTRQEKVSKHHQLTTLAPSPPTLPSFKLQDDGLGFRDTRRTPEEDLQVKIREISCTENAESIANLKTELERHEGLVHQLSQKLSRAETKRTAANDDLVNAKNALEWSLRRSLQKPHNGFYTTYDYPEYALLKRLIGDCDKNRQNYSYEASITPGIFGADESLVEVYPLKCPNVLPGQGRTWGARFPSLYQSTIQAARAGSKAAFEILMRLPDVNGRLKGWGFDYENNNWAFQHSGVSRVDGYNHREPVSTQNIDAPLSAKEKRLWLKIMLGLDNDDSEEEIWADTKPGRYDPSMGGHTAKKVKT
ncbi:hypothetical protein DL98DRAFT_527307 [Cadophora sp. DSE1049]|nr:hypothetical protein DL98DRAFT_527307 [Cadophora sp. DSE1049]